MGGKESDSKAEGLRLLSAHCRSFAILPKGAASSDLEACLNSLKRQGWNRCSLHEQVEKVELAQVPAHVTNFFANKWGYFFALDPKAEVDAPVVPAVDPVPSADDPVTDLVPPKEDGPAEVVPPAAEPVPTDDAPHVSNEEVIAQAVVDKRGRMSKAFDTYQKLHSFEISEATKKSRHAGTTVSYSTSRKRTAWRMWKKLSQEVKEEYLSRAIVSDSSSSRAVKDPVSSRFVPCPVDTAADAAPSAAPVLKKRLTEETPRKRLRTLAAIGASFLKEVETGKNSMVNVPVAHLHKRMAKSVIQDAVLPAKKKGRMCQDLGVSPYSTITEKCSPCKRPAGAFTIPEETLQEGVDAVSKLCCIWSRRKKRIGRTWSGPIAHCYRKSPKLHCLSYRQVCRRTARGKLGVLKTRKQSDMCSVCDTYRSKILPVLE